jgi:microcompartment protein CcmL/EutN
MLKAAKVQLLLARTICAGKFLIVVGGEVAAVDTSVAAGVAKAGPALVEHRSIRRVHPSVFPAISMAVAIEPAAVRSLGVVETFSASSIVEVADACAKAANVTLLRIHLAMALGGKGFLLLTGDVAAVEAAIAKGARVASTEGMLVGTSVIPSPAPELLRENM